MKTVREEEDEMKDCEKEKMRREWETEEKSETGGRGRTREEATEQNVKNIRVIWRDEYYIVQCLLIPYLTSVTAPQM